MADPAETTKPQGESVKPDTQPINHSVPDGSGALPEATSQSPSSSLPPVDPSLSAAATSLPPVPPSLPSIGSPMPPAEPSLPAADKSVPPLDPTLPAPKTNNPARVEQPGIADTAPAENTAAALPHTGNDAARQSGNPTRVAPGQGTNGMYQQPQQQSPPPPQQSQFHPQNPGMSHNSHAGAHSLNTGSIQTGGHVQGQYIPQAPIGSPLPTNMPPMGYMGGYQTNMSQVGVNPSPQVRYQMPGDTNSMLSAGRNKKEVKRRTKTGCLTCRKRRIKCDEGHPVCRNCVKSKRECLGYDPVFRPPPTPSTIQPAPNPSASLVVNPQDPSYSAAPPGYVPASSHPLTSHHSESPTTSTDYGATVDPALEANNTTTMAGVPDSEGPLQSALNPTATGPAPATEHSSFRLKQVRISDLLALKGIPPPPPHPIGPLPQGRLEEIQAVFLATYAPAFDKFLETRWFQEKALTHVMANPQLMAEYSALIDAFNDRNLHDPNVIARLESFEASVIWSTIILCRQVSGVSNGSQGQNYDLMIAASRLSVIEALITGDHLDTNPLAQFPPPPANSTTLPDKLAQRSFEFWSTVGHFLTLHDNEASSAKELDDTLARARTVLDTFENRDVIYSIAIARHLGQRWADFPHSFPQPITTSEKDAGAKLYVAQKFLEQEASGQGTTQVIKRICGMVVRSWYIARE